MSDALKDFIVNNREGFDSLEPGDLWSKIDTGLQNQQFSFNPKNITNMLKYGFGASALIVGTFMLVNSQKEKAGASLETRAIHVDSPLLLFKTPKINAGALLMTEIKQERKQDSVPRTDKAENNEVPLNNIAQIAYKQDSVQPENIPAAAVTAPMYSPSRQLCKDSLQAEGYTVVDTIFSGIKRVEVNVEFCSVNVRAIPGDKVALHARLSELSGNVMVCGKWSYKKSECKLRYEKKDTVLTIWMEYEKVNKKISSWKGQPQNSVLDLEVPVKTGVMVKSESGNLSASGLENRSMLLETTFGNIKAEDISSELTLKSSSGNITLSKIKGSVKTSGSFGSQFLQDITGNIKLSSSSGRIWIRGLKGDAEVNSSFGNQKYEDIRGNIHSHISSGSMSVKNLRGNVSSVSSFGMQSFEDIEGDISSKASSGSIKISNAKGMLALSTSFGNISGKDITLVKNGDFKTSSGSISMYLLNDAEDLSFDLASSSGRLSVEKNNYRNSSDEKLVIKQGPILVKGVSSFGNQSYR